VTTILLTIIILILLTLAVRSDGETRSICGLWLNDVEQQGWRLLQPQRFINRRVGLLNTPALPARHGILLRTRSVHMTGMLFPLDLVAIDRHGRVLQIAENVAPNTATPRFPRSTSHILEIAAGQCATLALRPGDHLSFGDRV
jgi:hypothetical protein